MRGKRWRRYKSLSISERYTLRPYQASVTVTVPFKGLPKAWLRIVKSSDLSLTPHGLRHAYASAASDLGYTEPTIAAMIGHSSNTSRYIHHLDTALISAADEVSEWIAESMNRFDLEEESLLPTMEHRI
jgi:integrase